MPRYDNVFYTEDELAQRKSQRAFEELKSKRADIPVLVRIIDYSIGALGDQLQFTGMCRHSFNGRHGRFDIVAPWGNYLSAWIDRHARCQEEILLLDGSIEWEATQVDRGVQRIEFPFVLEPMHGLGSSRMFL